MAQRRTVTLIDDTDGTGATETVRFALDGVSYEIDLSGSNAKALRAAVGPWADKARSSGKPSKTRRTLSAVGESRNALIRAWAASQGIDVPARGRIPGDVQRGYDAAH